MQNKKPSLCYWYNPHISPRYPPIRSIIYLHLSPLLLGKACVRVCDQVGLCIWPAIPPSFRHVVVPAGPVCAARGPGLVDLGHFHLGLHHGSIAQTRGPTGPLHQVSVIGRVSIVPYNKAPDPQGVEPFSGLASHLWNDLPIENQNTFLLSYFYFENSVARHEIIIIIV